MAVVFSGNGAPYYNSAGGNLDVGDCGTWAGCNGIGVARSYFAVSDTPLNPQNGVDVKVFDADVFADEIWNAYGCTATPVNLYETNGAISTSTKWGGPASTLIGTVSSANGGSSSCPAGGVFWNSWDGTGGSTLLNYVQEVADANLPTITFGLLSGEENNQYGWKQFADNNATINPALNVTFEFAPSTPTTPVVAGAFTCDGTNYAPSNTPQLRASSYDNSPSGYSTNVGMSFQIYSPTAEVAWNPTPVSEPSQKSSPATFAWTSNALPDGPYWDRAQAQSMAGESPNATSAWSASYNFTVSTTKPNAPTITSFSYPKGNWGAPAGTTNTSFNLSATTSGAPIVAFAYAWTQSGLKAPTPGTCPANLTAAQMASMDWVAASNGSATLNFPNGLPSSSFNQTLYVEAIDAAGNVSSGPPSSYQFYVPQIQGDTNWKLEGEQFGAITNTSITQPAGQNSCFYEEGPDSQLSGGYQEHLIGDAQNQYFNFNFESGGFSAYYALGVELSTQYVYGNLSFSLIDDAVANAPPLALPTGAQPNAQTVSGYAASPGGTLYYPLGGAQLSANTAYTIRVTFASTNGSQEVFSGTYGPSGGPYPPCVMNNYSSNGYNAGIDYFIVTPIDDASYATFSAAMNNHGLVTDGASTSGNFDFNGNNLSETALAAKGFGQGQAVTVNRGTPYQTTFTMPVPNSSGNDNVVADGQTIALATPVLANTVDFLVVATCATSNPLPSEPGLPNYSTPVGAQYAFSVNTPNGMGANSVSNALLPQVPDWGSGVLGQTVGYQNGESGLYLNNVYLDQVATLGYADTGSTATPSSSWNGGVYFISIPNGDPYFPVASVTLPELGTSFLAGCVSPALHVLAMSTTPPVQSRLISASADHTLAITANETVDAWGNNADGQLGNGTTVSSTTAVPVPGLSNVIAVSSGGEDSMALESNGSVWAWGNNNEGQLGNGTTSNSDVPVQVAYFSGGAGQAAIAISAGNTHSMAVNLDGVVWNWGDQASGESGNGSTLSSPALFPTAVGGLSGITQVVAAGSYDLALNPTSGAIWSWGANGAGQLGNGTTTSADTPTLVAAPSGMTNVVTIEAHGSESEALTAAGTVYAWGLNTSGQLGNGTTTNSDVPVQVQGLSGIVAIAVGDADEMALTSSQTVFAWGANNDGQIGNGTTTASDIPVQVSGLSGVTSIAGGDNYGVAIVGGTGQVWGWGDDTYGQLGNGVSGRNYTTPQEASTPLN